MSILTGTWHGSTVVAIRTPDAIVLAADSRLTFTEAARSSKVHDNACKIIMRNGTVFAMAGIPVLEGDV